MSFFDRFKDKTVTLLGAGVSNTPLVKKLTDAGANVRVRDKKTEEALGETAELFKDAGAELILGDSYLDNLDGDYIFRSPGFRPDIEPITKAVAGGSILTSEMEMFLANAPCPVIGVTGSDGKSTTTTLISKILAESGLNAFLGGNIGEPLLHRIDDIKKDDIVAAELSSFQLMTIDTPLSVAVIKNVTPNHLNWHTGMDEYIEAKSRILVGCKRAVLCYDDSVCRSLTDKADGEIYWFSRKVIPEEFLCGKYGGVYPENGTIVVYDPKTDEKTPVMQVSDILLKGEHNTENYSTAIAATWNNPDAPSVKIDAIKRVATTFGGVKHRFETVCEKGGIRYINSSIDSSPTRTAAAISALTCPINIICGGYDKKIPFEPLAEALISHGKVKTVVLTGATMDKIKKAMLENKGFSTSGIELLCVPDFKEAVLCAAGRAKIGEAVLLSPACASFDAFPNFEERGECFREIVKSL